jgi:hypothetical protein
MKQYDHDREGFVVIYGEIFKANLNRVNANQNTFTVTVEDNDTLHVRAVGRFFITKLAAEKFIAGG